MLKKDLVELALLRLLAKGDQYGYDLLKNWPAPGHTPPGWPQACRHAVKRQ